MTAAERLVARLHARGVTLEADPPDLVVTPADAVTADEVAALRRHKAAVLKLVAPPRRPEVAPPRPPIPEALRLPAPVPETPVKDLVSEYRLILGRLYALAALDPDADAAQCRALLQEQMKLHDEIGPVFAEAIDKQYSRLWAAREQRCPMCGEEGVFHDPATGEVIPITIDTIIAWTAGPSGPPAPEVPRGWPDMIEGLGPRRPGPFTPCWTCNRGTFISYGGRPLCRTCASREQQI